jgi:hypothetical protein
VVLAGVEETVVVAVQVAMSLVVFLLVPEPVIP